MIETNYSQLYVLLVFDGMYLFVPQEEVQSVEIIADVHITHTSMGAVGWFGHGNESPVFCLAEDLSLLFEIPENREYFVLLKAEPQPLGITCDEVEDINLKREHLHLHYLPPVMRTNESPISQLLIYQGKIGCVCHGTALIKHLERQIEQFTQSEN